MLAPDTRTALTSLAGAGLLDDALARDLIRALDLLQAIQGMLQLSVEETGNSIPKGLEPTLAKLGGASDFEDLREKIQATAERVHGHFRDLIEIPAGTPGDAGQAP